MFIKKDLILKSKKPVNRIIGYIVYFLLKGDEIVYIGSTRNLNFRMEYHYKTKDFDYIYYIKTRDEETMFRVEAENIINYNPKYNKLLNEKYITISYIQTYIKKMGYKVNKKEIKKAINSLSISVYEFKDLYYVSKEDIKDIIYFLIGGKNVLPIK